MRVLYGTRKSNVIKISDKSVLSISSDELFCAVQNLFGHIHDHVMVVGSIDLEFTSGTSDLASIESCIGCSQPFSKVIDLLSDIL